ncbi:hypothetical protein PMAC_003047 [Pneumocystis sp. 'macacae']|nr:hypothetical protein PMAC_003047 [Pneumocystis sp. 'macacae']
MFYSETILSKKGPLAKIWLAAHWEKKLSKSQFLQTNIKQSVNAIVNQDLIPMALRLSGQLLLGVVKVYSRKTRYLLEDCNEALMKIKMAFRQGNVDLPASNNLSISLQSAQLVLPETITEFDLLIPDPTFNMMDIDEIPEPSSFSHISKKQDITLISAFEPSIEVGRGHQLDLIDDPLVQADESQRIDLDFGIGDNNDLQDDISVEIGRDRVSDSRFSQEFSDIIGLEKDMDNENTSPADAGMNDHLNTIHMNDMDGPLEPVTEFSIHQLETVDQDNGLISEDREQIISGSSSTLTTEILEFDELQTGIPESNKTTRSKNHQLRYKGALEDSVIEISSKTFSSQLRNTSSITKQNKLLSPDPVFLALIQLQTSGKFGTHILQPLNVHSSIASLLNPGYISFMQSSLFKRKRIGNIDQNDYESTSPFKHPKIDTVGINESKVDTNLSSSNIKNFEFENSNDIFFPVDDPIPIYEDSEINTGEVFDSPIHNFSIKQDKEIELINRDAFNSEIHDDLDLIPILRNTFSSEKNAFKNTIDFEDIIKNESRINISKRFLEILILATRNLINIKQKESYGNIQISASKELFGNNVKILLEKDQNIQDNVKKVNN